MTIRRQAFPTLAALVGLSGLFAAPAQAGDISLQMDEARMITFGVPVKTVFVGNPLIADVTVIDPRHVFVLGKAYGTTNLVALDAAGNQAANDQVSVLGRAGSIVTVQRGIAQMTLACDATRCEAAPSPGDAPEQFDAYTGQIDTRQTLSMKAAGGQ